MHYDRRTRSTTLSGRSVISGSILGASPAGAIVNFLKKAWTKKHISARAKLFPIHNLGPAPNGKKAIIFFSFPASSIHRSGKKRSACSQ